MKNLWITLLKLALMLAILGGVGWQLYKAWYDAYHPTDAMHHPVDPLDIDWHFAPLAILGFIGSMLTSALVWRWIARKMGDKSPTIPLLGAYTFSQMGKYMPGKVLLLLMRIHRTGRFGMDPRTCTLSTLLENFIYLISGGLAGLVGLVAYNKELRADEHLGAARFWVLPACAVLVAVLISATHPAIFYRIMNVALKKFNRPPVDAAQRLRMGDLLLCVIMFLPCWAFGGIALWASARCVEQPMQPILPFVSVIVLMGAFALGVIIGMVSLLPGGIGIREAMLGFFLTLELTHCGVEPNTAIRYATVAAILQRFFQIIVEAGLGLLGALLTSAVPKNEPATTP